MYRYITTPLSKIKRFLTAPLTQGSLENGIKNRSKAPTYGKKHRLGLLLYFESIEVVVQRAQLGEQLLGTVA